MSDMRSLNSAAAFREAIYWACLFGVVSALVGATLYHMGHWYIPHFAGVLSVALAVSGFAATLALLVAYYHRRVLLGLGAAAAAFALPVVALLGSLYIARIPLESTPLWTVIPVGVSGEVVFKIVKALHGRRLPIVDKPTG